MGHFYRVAPARIVPRPLPRSGAAEKKRRKEEAPGEKSGCSALVGAQAPGGTQGLLERLEGWRAEGVSARGVAPSLPSQSPRIARRRAFTSCSCSQISKRKCTLSTRYHITSTYNLQPNGQTIRLQQILHQLNNRFKEIQSCIDFAST